MTWNEGAQSFDGACVNVDECGDEDLNICEVNATCADTEGSFTCTCNAGYEGDGTVCSDIDECGSYTAIGEDFGGENIGPWTLRNADDSGEVDVTDLLALLGQYGAS